MHRMSWKLIFILTVLTGLGLIASPPVAAQGRPDLVWMRGAHTNPVRALAYSPDGKLLASGSCSAI